MEPEHYSTLRTRRGFIRQATCAALGTAGLTNTIRDLRFINAAMAQTAINDYKALVCIFLNGGNDANNFIIPTIQSEYDNYAAIRTPVLAIPLSGAPTPACVLKLDNADFPNSTPLNSDGHSYGFHPACPEMRTLFSEGKLAPLFNVGTLVYPLTKAQYNSGAIAKPPQLFSHSDQQTQWQTSIPDRPPSSGWGGRCADLLDAVNSGQTPPGQIALAVTLAGSNTFEVGNVVQQYSVSTSGAVALSVPGTAAQQTARKNALQGLLGLDVDRVNLQNKAYADALNHGIAESGVVNNSITPTASAGYWTTPFPTTVVTPNGGSSFSSGLATQLRMVARLIEAGHRPYTGNVAGTGLGMKRQIFFVQVGGYDTHTGQAAGATPDKVVIGQQANLFAELSQCILAFQRAMEQLNLSNKVTSFTMSDFGRTFPSNGQGSDHGWGSHHIVVGGAVNGRKTYGKFPTLAVNGPDDTNTGRWIPTTSVDQYAATLASWFGVDNSKLSTVFPNLGRFATAPGFMTAS